MRQHLLSGDVLAQEVNLTTDVKNYTLWKEDSVEYRYFKNIIYFLCLRVKEDYIRITFDICADFNLGIKFC